MRIPRLRVFDITVQGLKTWRENAGNRVSLEVQHELATCDERFKGCSVRVQEKYIGGAKAPREPREDRSNRETTEEP